MCVFRQDVDPSNPDAWSACTAFVPTAMYQPVSSYFGRWVACCSMHLKPSSCYPCQASTRAMAACWKRQGSVLSWQHSKPQPEVRDGDSKALRVGGCTAHWRCLPTARRSPWPPASTRISMSRTLSSCSSGPTSNGRRCRCADTSSDSMRPRDSWAYRIVACELTVCCRAAGVETARWGGRQVRLLLGLHQRRPSPGRLGAATGEHTGAWRACWGT